MTDVQRLTYLETQHVPRRNTAATVISYCCSFFICMRQGDGIKNMLQQKTQYIDAKSDGFN